MSSNKKFSISLNEVTYNFKAIGPYVWVNLDRKERAQTRIRAAQRAVYEPKHPHAYHDIGWWYGYNSRDLIEDAPAFAFSALLGSHLGQRQFRQSGKAVLVLSGIWEYYNQLRIRPYRYDVT